MSITFELFTLGVFTNDFLVFFIYQYPVGFILFPFFSEDCLRATHIIVCIFLPFVKMSISLPKTSRLFNGIVYSRVAITTLSVLGIKVSQYFPFSISPRHLGSWTPSPASTPIYSFHSLLPKARPGCITLRKSLWSMIAFHFWPTKATLGKDPLSDFGKLYS